MEIIFYIAFYAAFTYWAYNIGTKKGFDPFLSGLAGFFFNWIAIVVLYIRSPNNANTAKVQHNTQAYSSASPQPISPKVAPLSQIPTVSSTTKPKPKPKEVVSIPKSNNESEPQKLALSLVSKVMDLPYLYKAAEEKKKEGLYVLIEDLNKVVKLTGSTPLPKNLGKFYYAVQPASMMVPKKGNLLNKYIFNEESQPGVVPMLIIFYEYGLFLMYDGETKRIRWSDIKVALFTHKESSPMGVNTLWLPMDDPATLDNTWIIQDDILAFSLLGILAKFQGDHGAKIKIKES
jgi:hypothetical protein